MITIRDLSAINFGPIFEWDLVCSDESQKNSNSESMLPFSVYEELY